MTIDVFRTTVPATSVVEPLPTITTVRDLAQSIERASVASGVAASVASAAAYQLAARVALTTGKNATPLSVARALGYAGDGGKDAALDWLSADYPALAKSLAAWCSHVNNVVKREVLNLRDIAYGDAAVQVREEYDQRKQGKDDKSPSKQGKDDKSPSKQGKDESPETANATTLERLAAAVEAMELASRGAVVGLAAMTPEELAQVEQLSRRMGAALHSFGAARVNSGTVTR